MPSSTSSSESRRILALAAGIALLAIVSLETFARSLGVVPSVLDSKDLWSEVRDDVYGRDKVVLIGASRILFDVSPQTFEAQRPGPIKSAAPSTLSTKLRAKTQCSMVR